MLKQVVVDKVMARQLWKLGFREPTLSHYDLNGELQTADGELFRSHLVCRSGLATPKKAPRITDMPRYFFSEYRRLLLPTYSAFGWLKP